MQPPAGGWTQFQTRRLPGLGPCTGAREAERTGASALDRARVASRTVGQSVGSGQAVWLEVVTHEQVLARSSGDRQRRPRGLGRAVPRLHQARRQRSMRLPPRINDAGGWYGGRSPLYSQGRRPGPSCWSTNASVAARQNTELREEPHLPGLEKQPPAFAG